MKDISPIVSIIVSTYNRKEYLKDTIISILNQTFQNFELLVVDDGSTDGTNLFIETFKDKRIKYFRTKNWGGPAKPRNIGIQHAKGDFIAFCDDDDLWKPDKLRIQMGVLLNTKHPIGICFTNFEYLQNGEVSGIHKYKKWYKNLTFNRFILSNGCVALSSAIINKRVLNNLSLFTEDKELIAFEDYDFFARILKAHKAIYLEDVLLTYRLHSGSLQAINKNHFYQLHGVLNSINSKVGINTFIYLLKYSKIFLLNIVQEKTNRNNQKKINDFLI